jgi:polyisoprenoid-binding protein YceI
MRKGFLGTGLAALLLAVTGQVPARAADDYTIDGMHTGVTFKVSHIGLSWTYGRFNDVSGNFTIDPEAPAKSSFNLTVKVESVDTGNAKRDGHLRSPDFFNVKQFPLMTFKSTSIEAIKGGFKVTGDLTLHGETKPVTFSLLGGRTAEFPKGIKRTGYSTDLTLKRSDFGMDKMKEAIGDDVYVSISFEGVKK